MQVLQTALEIGEWHVEKSWNQERYFREVAGEDGGAKAERTFLNFIPVTGGQSIANAVVTAGRAGIAERYQCGWRAEIGKRPQQPGEGHPHARGAWV